MSHNSIESFYRSFLSKPVESTSTPPFYIYVDKTPLNNSWTLSGFITLSPNTKSEEIMEYDLVDSNSKSIRITKRGIKPNATSLTTNGVDYNNTLYKFSHSPQDET